MHAIPSQMYKEIGQGLINSMPELAYIKASSVQIAFLVSDQVKKEGRVNYILAETEKIPDKYKWGMYADFSITVYSPNVADLSTEQKRILIFQQLLKIGIEYNEDKDEEKYSINEPDVVDFSVIINRYGVNWKTTQRELFDDYDTEKPAETALDVMKGRKKEPEQTENGFDIFK